MGKASVHRLDELRRFAAALTSAAGMVPERAATFAGHLLWFDTAGFPDFGLKRLPDWLDRMGRGEVDPIAEPLIRQEHPATAILDGQRGVAPLALARAADVAAAKARELGVGLARIGHLGGLDSAAPIAADLAIGPFAAMLVGPRPSWALALPTGLGLPVVFDTDLDAARSTTATASASTSRRAAKAAAQPSWMDLLGPWAGVIAPDDGWLVLVVAITALEPLTTFHERAHSALEHDPSQSGPVLSPGPWDERRRQAREDGIQVDPELRSALNARADRLGIAPLPGTVETRPPKKPR